jgi:uncharacterized membrane protein
MLKSEMVTQLKSAMVTRLKSAMRRLKYGIARLRIEMIKRRKLEWSRLYGLTSYLKSTLWTVPVVAMFLQAVLMRVAHWLDPRLGWTLTGLSVTEAQLLYQTIITAMLSFLVFTFGSLLVAIQVASGQMTPRVIATTLLRDNTVRFTVGLFVFTLMVTLNAAIRAEALRPRARRISQAIPLHQPWATRMAPGARGTRR